MKGLNLELNVSYGNFDSCVLEIFTLIFCWKARYYYDKSSNVSYLDV